MFISNLSTGMNSTHTDSTQGQDVIHLEQTSQTKQINPYTNPQTIQNTLPKICDRPTIFFSDHKPQLS